MLAVIAHGEDAFRPVDATGRDVGWGSELSGTPGLSALDAAHHPGG